MVVFDERHFKIQSHKLRQVTVSEGELGTEHCNGEKDKHNRDSTWGNLKNALKVGADCHLLVELRALSKVSILLEI